MKAYLANKAKKMAFGPIGTIYSSYKNIKAIVELTKIGMDLKENFDLWKAANEEELDMDIIDTDGTIIPFPKAV